MKSKILNIVDFFGKRFNFDARYFAKNTFWLLFGQIIMSVASFGVTFVLANYVAKHDVGNYRLVISLYSVLVFFAMSGLAQAFIKSIVYEKDGALQEALSIKRKYGLLAFGVGTIIALYFGVYRDNLFFGISIFVMSACLPFMETFSLYLTYLQGRKEFFFSSISQGLVKLASATAVAFIAYFNPALVYLIAAFYGVQAMGTYLMYKITIAKYPVRNQELDPGMASYGKHITLSGVPLMIFGQADKFILYHFFGPVALAHYWIASSIPQEVGRVLSTISQAAYPKFVAGDHVTIRKSLPKKMLYAAFVLVIISCAYTVVAYPFFHFFFPQYVEDVPKSIILMFAYAVIPYMFVWQYYAAQGNVKVVYISNSIDPILQCLLYLAFIPFFGVWGLVYAIFTKMIVMNCLAWYILKTE